MSKEIAQVNDKSAKLQVKARKPQARRLQEKKPQGMRLKMSEVARMSPETLVRLYRISHRSTQ